MVQKIKETTNYAIFTRSRENRPTDPDSRKKLRHSMIAYKFLPCFPIVCRRQGNDLIVQDGQHRLDIASELGIPVYYVECDTDFDIALINSAAKGWSSRDFANMYAQNGKEAYAECLAFSAAYKIPFGTACAMLAGNINFGNVQTKFLDGAFVVTDRAWAEQVAKLYTSLRQTSCKIYGVRLLEACMAVCRVEGFDPSRMIAGARRNAESLVSYSTRDGYLGMLETVYNFGRHGRQIVPLRVEAQKAMRARSAAAKLADQEG